MLFWLGETAILDGAKNVVVQDVDRLDLTALVGVPDENNMVWDAEWVDTSRLSRASDVEDDDAMRAHLMHAQAASLQSIWSDPSNAVWDSV